MSLALRLFLGSDFNDLLTELGITGVLATVLCEATGQVFLDAFDTVFTEAFPPSTYRMCTEWSAIPGQ